MNEAKRPLARILLAALTLLLAGALVSGCGSDKKAQFGKDFKPVNDELLALGSAVGQALGAADKTPDAILAGEFLGFASRMQRIKADVAALDPPGELKSQTRALSAGVNRLDADLRAIGTAARTKNPPAARAATVALLRDSQSAGDARRALARKTGARVGP